MAVNPRIIATQRLARISLLSALALVLSYIETMIPLPVALPGVKLGLATVAVVVALLGLDMRAAAAVAVVKVMATNRATAVCRRADSRNSTRRLSTTARDTPSTRTHFRRRSVRR